jgi:hypothetical protein
MDISLGALSPIVGASLLAKAFRRRGPPERHMSYRSWMMLNRSPTTISVIQLTRIEV